MNIDDDFCPFEMILAWTDDVQQDVNESWFALTWHAQTLVTGRPPASCSETMRDWWGGDRRWSFRYDVHHIVKQTKCLLRSLPSLMLYKALCSLVDAMEQRL